MTISVHVDEVVDDIDIDYLYEAIEQAFPNYSIEIEDEDVWSIVVTDDDGRPVADQLIVVPICEKITSICTAFLG